MSEIKSPLGKQTFTGAPRMLTVDDPTEAHPVYGQRPLPSQQEQAQQMTRELTAEERAELQRQRAEATATQTRVSPSVKNRLEYLSEIGRIKDVLEFKDGTDKAVKFHLRSLKSRELLEVHEFMVKLGKTTETKANFELRKQLLARSLWAIDNILIEDIINSYDLEDRLDFIEDLDENLVNSLQKFYEDNIVAKGREQYSVSTPKQMEEVVDDIKKS